MIPEDLSMSKRTAVRLLTLLCGVALGVQTVLPAAAPTLVPAPVAPSGAAADAGAVPVVHRLIPHPPDHVLAPEATRTSPDTTLQAAWSQIVASAGLRHAAIAGYAYDITTGTVLASLHGDWRLTPASVNKLFTSAAALADLGPDFRYTTTVRLGPATTTQAPTLYLVGGGDPWLEADSGRQLNAMAQAVALHIHHIARVVGVTSAFSGPRLGTGWTENDVTCNYTPNICALTAERDEIGVTVTGAAAGQLPRIQLFENDGGPVLHHYFHIINRGRVNNTGVNTLAITRTPGTNRIIVSGAIPSGQTFSELLSVHDPAAFATRLFAQLLRADGVAITGHSAIGALPASTDILVVHRSAPLAHYLQIQNTYSINLMAESLYRTLGAALFGAGTPANAHAAVFAFIHQAHLSPAFDSVDGSGLSPLDAVSPQQVVALLTYAAHQPWFRVFEHSLIHIGHTKQCSFMCGQMDGTVANRHVWMKTGDLGNQWNESGYARAANGDLIAFSLFFDGLNAQNFYQQAIGPEDHMVVAAAAWPDLPASEVRPDITPARVQAGQSLATAPVWLQPFIAAVGPLQTGDIAAISARLVQTGASVFKEHASMRLMPSLLPRLAILTDFLSQPDAGLPPAQLTNMAIVSVADPPAAMLGSLPWEDFVSAPARPRAPALSSLDLTRAHASSDARTRIIHEVLSAPSATLTLALTRELGATVAADMRSALGESEQIAEPTGLGLQNYATASSFSRLLVDIAQQPELAPLAHSLEARPWVVYAPEQVALVGYTRSAHGRWIAVSILVNGLLWDGSFAPQIRR
jgi:D-alanyl-D-alanine carboxypeptidase/D-alanyl-D-alanine-endopeptidase (penicillin-binding protein 4)